MGVDISINQWNTCIAANDQSQSSKMNESQQLTLSDLGWRHILIATNNNVNVYVYETMKTIWVCPVCIWTKHIFRANKSWYFHIHISIAYVFRSMEKHIKSPVMHLSPVTGQFSVLRYFVSKDSRDHKVTLSVCVCHKR